MTVEPLEKGYFYYLLGLVTNRIWKNLTSLEYSKAALEIFEEICEFKRSAECRILAGIINLRIENWDESKRQLKLAEKIATAINNSSLLGKIYHNLGYIEARKGDLTAALELYLKSLDYKENDLDSNVLPTLHNLIELHIKVAQSEEAIRLLNKGLQIIDTISYNQDYIFLLTHFKNVLSYGISHENTAIYIKDKLIPYFENKYDILRLNEFYPILGKFYENSKKYKLATHYYNLTINTYKKLTHTEEYY
ncbi:tetratricopeptide repeat protein [Fictibacillus halophilus]|uniref:tetratricopeptide repeat protein n=1 Tax=Fictibacillus halophilus TaxID=1610490 RepID=UPI001CFB1458|nr:tetratricopeptide repeat protein [Fictibacillus halophilus]